MTVNIATPTLTKYEQLYSKYSQTLICPCKNISTNYEKFLSIEYTLHQVCTSFFITDDWISYIAIGTTGYLVTGDFRVTGPYQFETLRAFCELINSTMSYSLIQFNSTQYITASVTPLQLFQSQAQSFIDQFKLSTTNNFLLSLNMSRKTIQGNVLLSGRQTNYKLNKVNKTSILFTTSRVYDNCICALSNTCIDNSSLFNGPNPYRIFNVTGFYVGCYTTEALLRSTLECFYNQTCIDQLQIYLLPPVLKNVTALDSSLPSQYSENSTIEYLLNNLMIEEWNSTQMYDRYYDECQPKECTYTINTRNNILYVITTLIGIIGGLTRVSKILVPISVKIIVYCFRKWRNSVVPQISIIQT
ncbi:unnamed protein product [Adineta steineri]|uniref:Uncharacterized protein n=1 Tax=Adineta steineri TaxID=433720 RepID=A0A816DFK5_9BILA|nr:unnamed protein product [Adineta steineri]CAF1636642.1 unnamed protein product [Adineta steineri]